MIIFRDDDIGFFTNVNEFKRVHEYFNEYGVTHTIAMLTRDVWKNERLVSYIKCQNNIDIQVHSFDHIDFIHATDEEMEFQLNKSIFIIENLFGKRPTIFYPTFNSVDYRVISIATKCGLETSYKKISALYYLRHNGEHDDTVINFHSWEFSEQIIITACLKLYSQKQKERKSK